MSPFSLYFRIKFSKSSNSLFLNGYFGLYCWEVYKLHVRKHASFWRFKNDFSSRSHMNPSESSASLTPCRIVFLTRTVIPPECVIALKCFCLTCKKSQKPSKSNLDVPLFHVSLGTEISNCWTSLIKEDSSSSDFSHLTLKANRSRLVCLWIPLHIMATLKITL